MAARGPQSLLDRRDPESGTHVVRDRLTRQRSPARSPRRSSFGSESEEEILSRISQPYRTSFSAVLPPTRGKKERSRSTSPCSSSLKGSERSRSKSPGGRRSGPKHVRYSDRVVIRESDTSDSIVTNLSDKGIEKDMNDTSGHFSADSSILSVDNSKMSHNSSQERDYSSELRELSQQIVREYSYPKDKENISENSSQNSSARTPNGNVSSRESQKPHVVKPKPKMVVTDSYDHDRSISYRAAIKDHYSDEIKHKADALIKEEAPVVQQKAPVVNQKPAESPAVKKSESYERRNSEPLEKDDTSNKLTPAKRSISSSIGNFFRRLSPHLPRRSKKGNLSNASSVSLSPDDLDGPFNRHASTGNLSKNKFRRSFQKLFGKSKKGSKSPRGDISTDDITQQDDNQSKSTPTSSVYMKSIEQGSKSDDMYHKFKNRNANRSSDLEKTTPVRPQAVRASASRRVTSPGEDSGLEKSDRKVYTSASQELPSPDQPHGRNSLDVKWMPKSARSFKGSQISGISGDDSIGECSINPNLSGKWVPHS